MTKHTSIIAVSFASLVLFSACTKQTPQTDMGSADSVQTENEVMSEWQEVANAISSGESARCAITNSETQETGEYFIKGEKMRYSLNHPTDPSKTASFISDSEYVYSWNEINKQGFKFEISKLESQPSETQEQQQVPDFTQEEVRNSYQELGYTMDCSAEDVSDDVFTPPSDVEFSDFSEFFNMDEG